MCMGDRFPRARMGPGGLRALLVVLLLATLGLAACARVAGPDLFTLAVPPTDALTDATSIAVWQTSPSGRRLAHLADLPFSRSCTGSVPPLSNTALAGPSCSDRLPAVVVDPARRFQRIAGFGGAFNELGWLALLSLSPAAR